MDNSKLTEEEYLNKCRKEFNEICSSITAGDELLLEIKKTKKLLNSAKGWIVLEGFDGGIISGIFIHHKLCKAEKCYSNISKLVNGLNTNIQYINQNNLTLPPINNEYIVYVEDAFSGMQLNIYVSNTYNKACNLERNINDIMNILNIHKEKLQNILNKGTLI